VRDGRPSVPHDLVRAALAADGVVDITTVGARSGRPRRSEIWFLHLDGRTFITGTPGPRNWYANLLAHDRLTFHLKESLIADLPARAVPVLDDATRRWVFTQPHRWNDWYLAEAGLEELVSGSPMVELHFDEEPS
jgi:deazaflavin-dependent oxidoreductase (nitroreductase family)